MLQVPDPNGKRFVTCFSMLLLGFEIQYTSTVLPIFHLLDLQFKLMGLGDRLLEVTPNLLQAIKTCVEGAKSGSKEPAC